MNIFVTGAGKGIGFSIVKGLAENSNHTIYAISRNIIKLKKLSKEKIKGSIIPISFDLNDLKTELKEISFLDNSIKIDILINNAGMLINKPFQDFSVNEIQELLHINMVAPSILIKLLLPQLNKKGAHIVNISSMGGFQGSSKYSGLSFYSASKGALAVLTECLATEYSNTNFKFNCLALGSVQTEMLNQAFPGYKAPLTADEMSDFIIDFAFNAQKYMNGKIIPVSLVNP